MEGMDLIDFSKEKKKKVTKKPKEAETAPKTEAAKTEEKAPEAKKEIVDDRPKYVDPYTYDQLLERIYNQLKTNNPSLAEKTKFIMKPPQVVKIGARRSAWTNFADICKNMRRDPEHVSLFFLTELGTEGSVAQDQLILKGKFIGKHIESLIRKYITEYVCCQLCKSPNTKLKKDSNTRLYMMECDACKSTRSVQTIKSGFHAVTKADRKKDKQG